MLKVGKVKIDDTHYLGEDLYTDGPVEDEMLEIAKSYSYEDYNKVIAERENWAILYHFSHLRENIISGLPISSKDSVLEIGAGCGAITGALAKKAGKVTCVDLSMKRSLINAHRHHQQENLEIHVGNFEDVEKTLGDKYDVITLIGVFEYAVGYISGSNPYEEFLQVIKKRLKRKGRIIIAIENRFGLKYWAGCNEDHTGLYFEGIEGYKNTAYARTFSHVELERMFGNVGFKEWEFYYPYPDYKFPLRIFSDDYLPEPGELNINNYVNFDKERLALFDEQAVYGSIIADGMYPYFANSFLVVLRGD
jgi:2-polyprenyl-3-methyl-5-hydroxy-6-metoxy-1,4-benzoquinol methylase